MNIARQFQKVIPVKTTPAKTLDIKLIRLDGGTQPRESIDASVVSNYADDIKDGIKFPPVVVFHDGETHWLADGYHRHAAHVLAGKAKIAVELRRGNLREAILFSVGVNAEHGLQRTNADKRRAIETLLRDPEWSEWSDREIGRRCRVDNKTVARIREEHLRNSSDSAGLATSEIRDDNLGNSSDERKVERAGTTYTMNTSAIGKPADAPDKIVSVVPPARDSSSVEDTVTPAPSPAAVAPEPDQRQAIKDSLPQAIKDREQAKAEWRARGKAGEDSLATADRVAELEETVRVLEAEVDELRAENKLYGEMKVQFEQGGFDKVVAGKDEEIRVLQSRVYQESSDKASWMRSAKYWQEQARKLGFSSNVEIDIETGEIING